MTVKLESDRRFQFLQWVAGVIMVFCAAAVPWAFRVQGTLSAIEARLDAQGEIPPTWFRAHVERNSERIRAIEKRLLDGAR